MAKVDMNQIKKDTVNSAETKELKKSEQTEAPAESVESTDNASEKTEDTNKTEKQTKASEKAGNTGKVVVSYIGGGIWRDSEGKLWASTNKTENILCERQYTAEEYEGREDIKFMVQYGSMKATHVK